MGFLPFHGQFLLASDAKLDTRYRKNLCARLAGATGGVDRGRLIHRNFHRSCTGPPHEPCGPSSYAHTVDRCMLACGLLTYPATLAGEKTHRGARTSHTTRRRRQGPLTDRRNDVANGLVGVCSGGFVDGAATSGSNGA